MTSPAPKNTLLRVSFVAFSIQLWQFCIYNP